MNNNLYLLLCLFFAAIASFGQENKYTSFFPEGKLIKTFSYSFSFENSSNVLATFNDVPLSKQGNTYVLIGKENGELKIYKTNNSDTNILVQRHLTFIDPTFTVDFFGTESGGVISKNRIKNKPFAVRIYNNDLSFNLPVEEANVLYQKCDSLCKIKVNEDYISKTLGETIISSASPFIILDLTIKFDNRKIHLPPAIFYIE